MNETLKSIDKSLRQILSAHVPPLKIRTNTTGNFEVAGTKETMQGKQKVDGFYFASVVPKPGDIRFYFFPNYTHAAEFEGMSTELKKCLKGKSCFHIKTLSPEMEKEITTMVAKAIKLYKKDNLI